MFKSISAAALLSLLVALPANAEPANDNLGEPGKADPRVYVFCSDVAAQRPLGYEEAIACGSAFDRVKLSFVQRVSPQDFKALSTPERAAVNLVRCKRFREWFDANPREIEVPREEIRAEPVAAGD